MLILALDTTTRAGSVAVTDDDRVLSVVHGDASRTHGERLPAEIEEALAAAAITANQLALLAVARGPGAFTGLRIGLAAIQGMAMVLNVPVVGVSALDALAFDAWPSRRIDEPGALAWMDAQRGEVFGAQYRTSGVDTHGGDTQNAGVLPAGASAEGFTPAPVAIVGTPHAILDVMTEVAQNGAVCVGDGAVRYRAQIESRFDGRCRVIEPPAAIATAVARIGRRLAAQGHAGPPHALQPLYVRRPDAELERQRRLTL